MRIAIDVMGGDHGAPVVLPAIAHILRDFPQVTILAFGHAEIMRTACAQMDLAESPRLQLHPSEQVVDMDESPLSALRNKRKSSMALAINAVREGKADACVSAGNTGALVALSRYLLKTLPGIDRPAIITALPTQKNPVHLLDMGANVDCEATHLIQFAQMASVMVESLSGKKPRVGILNIGTEAIKGNAVVKEALEQLHQNRELHFIGSVEGDSMFEGVADVVVCDGFVGNVALKITEGTAKLISFWLKAEIQKNFLRKISAGLCFPIWKGLKAKYDPRLYNGAILLGLQGVVVKSHGGADALAFRYAIEFAIRQIEQKINARITEHFCPPTG